MGAKRTVTGVITGDIIASRKTAHGLWLRALKKTLSAEGKSPRTWQIYRGDSFQVEIKDPARTLLVAIRIKATIKRIKGLDVRMAIGLGEKRYRGRKIAESQGEAFVHSGEKFETLKKEKKTMALKSPWAYFDDEMNVCLRLACIPMDAWTPNSAELILLMIRHPKLTQKALAKRLGITQPSISERQNRSHYEAVMELEALYREKINRLIA